MPAQHRLEVKEPYLLTLMFLSAFAAMGAVLMMPALPEIAAHFAIRMGTAQLAVTCFLLGYSFGQLLYGPLANRYGRKFALYIGIMIASLGSIFSIASSPFDSFHLLVLGRFLEAVGASAGLAVSVAIINDYYFESDVRRILGLLMLAFAIIPGIAIAIGGILVQYLQWQSCFYFLLLYGFLLIYPTMRLPETNLAPDKQATEYHHVFKNYWKQLTIKKTIGFAMISGFSSACIYVFGTEGPFIGIHLLRVPPALYGALALLPYLGSVLGSVVAAKLSKINHVAVLTIAFSFEFVGSAVLFILFFFHIISLSSMLIPMGFFCIGHPILVATAISLALKETEDKSNGSATVNATAAFMAVFMTFLLTQLHAEHALVLPAVLLVGMVLMATTFWWVFRASPTKPCNDPR